VNIRYWSHSNEPSCCLAVKNTNCWYARVKPRCAWGVFRCKCTPSLYKISFVNSLKHHEQYCYMTLLHPLASALASSFRLYMSDFIVHLRILCFVCSSLQHAIHSRYQAHTLTSWCHSLSFFPTVRLRQKVGSLKSACSKFHATIFCFSTLGSLRNMRFFFLFPPKGALVL
jgi:hypothetical protein